MDRYIAFDVETPNSRNDRMSAIGIAVIENGGIVKTFDTLVNPEAHFAPFNIALTGITPEMARTAPTFPEAWGELRALMESGVLIAHNAPFDLRVLSCCLNAYRLPSNPTARYACTVRLGRRCYPELSSHKLDALCRHLHIELDHHRAGSDSLACAKLFLNYIDAGIDPASFIRTYDLRHMRTV